jgi:hypothetical protein
MADNTTTYTTVVDVEVKGQKDVDNMSDAIDGQGEKFLSLRRQIRETTVSLQELADKGKDNSTQFRELSEHLKELQVQQKKVAFEAKNTTDKLAELPGPLGSIGKGLKDAKESMEVFGKSTYVALGVIGLIVGAFVAMKDALSKTEEGQQTLSKVTDALGKITAPLFALFEKVGIPIFLKFAEVVEWVGNKVNKFVEWLGVSKSKVSEIATEGNKAFYDAAQKDLDNMAVVQGILKKQDEDAKAKAKERNKKYLDDLAEQQRLAADKEKKDLEYQLQEIEKIRKKFAAQATIVAADTLKSKTADAKKIEDEEIKRAKEGAEMIRLLKINSEEKQIEWSKKNQTSALSREIDAKTTAVHKESALDKWLGSEKKKQLDENLMAVKAGLNLAGNLVDQGSDAAKAIAVAQTTIDTYQSATAAYKAVAGIPVVGPALAVAAAGAAIAAGIMSVNKIINTQVPKMGTGGDSSVSGAGVDITPPSAPALSIPQFNSLGGSNPTSQIAQSLAMATGKPIRAYVVSSDITSQQSLDRRTNTAATFTGG